MSFKLVDETVRCAACLGGGFEYIHKFDLATDAYTPIPRKCQACNGLGTYDRIAVELVGEEE